MGDGCECYEKLKVSELEVPKRGREITFQRVARVTMWSGFVRVARHPTTIADCPPPESPVNTTGLLEDHEVRVCFFPSPIVGTPCMRLSHSCWSSVVTVRKLEDSYEGLYCETLH